MRTVFAAAWLVTSLVACSSPSMAPDAAMPDASIVAPPASPVFTPCPDGWREVVDDAGLTTCDAYPASGRDASCAMGEAHFAGTPGCAPIGAACPADGWPGDLPTDRTIVFVDDDAAAGGDGTTRATALRSVRDAAVLAPAGALIAVATGHYDDEVVLADGQSLVGACPSGTVLTTSVASTNHATLTLASHTAVRDLAIVGSERAGLSAPTGADASVDGVWIDGVRTVGLFVHASTVTAHDVVIRGTRAALDRTLGRGIDVETGATVTLARALLDTNREIAFFVEGSSTVDASELTIAGTLPSDTDASHGDALYSQMGAQVSVARSVLEGQHGRGVLLGDPGTHVSLTDVIVRGDGTEPAGPDGRALDAELGAAVVLTRVLVEDDRDMGLIAGNPGTTIEAHDLVVRRIAPSSDGTHGLGVDAEPGASVTLDRARIEAAHDLGVLVSGATLSANDLVVVGTLARASDQSHGRGISVEAAGTLTLVRARLEGNREVGITVGGAGATVTASDLVIRGTLTRMSDGHLGVGIDAQGGAQLMLTRALVAMSHYAGVLVSDMGTSLVAMDLSVEDTAPDDVAGALGAGVWAQLGAQASITGGHVVRSHMAGVASVREASVVLDGVDVTTVDASACPIASSCAGMTAGGFGLVAQVGGTLRASHFTIGGASVCDVLVGVGDGTTAQSGMDLAMGLVTDAPVGACVQVDGYDTERLHDAVSFGAVGVPLQATSYALPDGASLD